jgi:MFS family permease
LVKHSRDITFIASIVYFAQGALGISGVALPLYLRSLKWSVAEITAITSIAAAPWLLKILYGLISDTFPLFGFRRKSYLMLCSVVSAVGWISLVFMPPEKHWILMSLMLTNFGFAATDVITDGLIVEHSTGISSPIYQAIAWGSRSFGAVMSGFLGGWLAAHWAPQDIFVLTMFLPLTVMVSVMWIRERKFERSPFRSAFSPVKRCAGLIIRDNLKWFTAILFVVSISASIGIPFFFFMRETLGFKETFLGLLSSLGWGGAMVGSVIYGRWLRHISPKTTLRWAILMNAFNILGTLLIKNEATALTFVFIGGIMGCLVMLPIMSSAAALTHHTGVESTLFAVLMSVFNLGQIVFGFLGGKFFGVFGLYPLIILTGVIAIGGILFVEKLNFDHPPPKPALPAA